MKTTVTESKFVQAFHDMGRGDQFTYAGLTALFGYLEEIDEACGTETELDVIAICCNFSEAESAVGWCEEAGYELDYSGCDDEEEREEVALEFLQDNTQVITFDGGVIAAGF